MKNRLEFQMLSINFICTIMGNSSTIRRFPFIVKFEELLWSNVKRERVIVKLGKSLNLIWLMMRNWTLIRYSQEDRNSET